uniref:hypothetical protein n=1 Tax=Clostridium akagii TaxID=91623 RepID=UPI00056213EF|nr:hypothetical protein [Clostridium akagii]
MLNREDCYSIVAKCWDVSNFYNVHVGWASIPIEEYYNIKNKYLDRKGNDIFYEDIICPNCGCTVDTMVNEDNALWCGCGERFYKIKNT